jgi:hypothetical protein
MKLINVHLVDGSTVEDYLLDEDDPDITVRIIDTMGGDPEQSRTAYLGYKDRYTHYNRFMGFVFNDFKEEEFSTFNIDLKPHLRSRDSRPAIGREVNFFIQLGCITIGKDRVLNLISNNKDKVTECLKQRQPQLQGVKV